MTSGRLLVIVNDPGFFCSHRLPIALGARAEGYEVHVATGSGPEKAIIAAAGFVHHTLPITRSGRNPFIELFGFLSILWLMIRIKPELVHLVTVKPVLYGGIAARLTRIPGVVAAVSGLGFVFVGGNARIKLLRWFVLRLYKLALGKPTLRVIFQNPSDRAALVDTGIVDNKKTLMIRGSGVNLNAYRPSAERTGSFLVVLVARLLWDKGVGEFVEAARLLQDRGIAAKFALVGIPDPGNPASVGEEQLTEWASQGIVELWGFRDDIENVFAAAHIVALPSYREGLPKVLIEAAACGRAVVTTDVPGCRDAIEPNVTGLLIPPHDPVALADAIQCLLEDTPMRQAMGRAGRDLAEREFSIDKVIDAHLAIYRSLSWHA
ncbi:MAG: glycosyl transferase family 1 [Deltaproteobacteria bacterium RIFCSPLOWO2_02_FULL_53_8]|nr:MAG: glycosyl transferase family 1 [Deltaproteobacteria bacterium RIFCSPLOWO2_02_FULL_53_8]